MNRPAFRLLASAKLSLTLLASAVLLPGADATAQSQCTDLTTGLQAPLGITRSDEGNLFVSESGTGAHDGRITIVDRHGNRRNFLGGLPSGLNDVNEPSGPAGVLLCGETLYVLIGVGNSVLFGGAPGRAIPNPNVTSPLFSSVLAIHFSSRVEKFTAGFTLLPEHHQALASGERVKLSNGGRDRITIELIANFPDFFSVPLTVLPENVQASNPFDLVLVQGQERHRGDHQHSSKRDDGDDDRDRCRADLLFVTDGGRNHVWRVDIHSGEFSILAPFPQVSNPLAFPPFPPFIDAVPTGIAYSEGQLLVALFRGAPFPPGISAIEQVDPLTGNRTPFISGLTKVIDVLSIRDSGDTDYLVLEHAADTGPFFPPPARLLRFETPTGPSTLVTDCLTRPTSMTLNRRTDTLYITELGGRIVRVSLTP